MTPRWAVINFPGSNCERDCIHALRNVLGYETIECWHKDPMPDDIDCIVIPGGFSYGDYLRAGALAAMSPVMRSVKEHAERGTLILGICNGFQVLCETGLLPGALVKNTALRFRCRDAYLRVERTDSPFTAGTLSEGDVIRVPIAHGYGNYFIPESERASIAGQILFRYCDEQGNITPEANPNGSVMNIAGITNARGNVLGMMPHPERACEPILGSVDGIKILKAMAQNAGKVKR